LGLFDKLRILGGYKEYSFEKLQVWSDIRMLIRLVYSVTGDLPDSEKFGMVNQMRRASISISSNLAEGSSRTSAKDQAHFYQIAYSSLMELLSQAIISYDLNFITEETYITFRKQIQEITLKLNALRNNALKRANVKPLNP
jgi:four helix bundle protein